MCIDDRLSFHRCYSCSDSMTLNTNKRVNSPTVVCSLVDCFAVVCIIVECFAVVCTIVDCLVEC